MYNGHDGVSNHQPYDCLLNRLFRRRSKKTSKLRVTGLCEGISPVTGEFPAQRTSNAENKCKGLNFKCHLNIRKHRPWAYILGFIELPYFGSWTVSADILGWTYLYLYLNPCICICICIWIKVEENICICICIWKIQIFVFVFVFVFDKTYLTPTLETALLCIDVSHWVGASLKSTLVAV